MTVQADASFLHKSSKWFAPPRSLSVNRSTDPPRLRLFCFPHSGAAASVFYPWLRHLPASIELYPVQYPGRGTRLAEPAFSRLQPLVENLLAEMPAYLDIPFAFFGHSLGALVGFEVACALSAANLPPPLHLFVSGHPAPHLPADSPPTYNLPDDQFIEKLRQMNGISEEMLQEAELMEMLLPILRADFEASETYIFTPKPPLPCPLTALGGLHDQYVSRSALEAWGQQTSRAFTVRVFPGDHFYLNTAQPLLLESIIRTLQPLLASPPPISSQA
jgi:medium-chain acyl-[acyl-carrier-protein] hydrolase